MKLYNTKQVAQILKKDISQITRYLISGKLKGQHIGKLWIITEKDLNEYLKNLE